MIEIAIFRNQQGYCGIECNGHAFFADSGKDVVCAAVSVLVINTINGIEQFTEDAISLEAADASTLPKKKFWQKKTEEPNFIRFHMTGDMSESAKVLMDVLVMGLTEIRNRYGETYLTLEFREV